VEWNHTVNGANRMLVVGVAAIQAGAGGDNTAVTYGGVALTKRAEISNITGGGSSVLVGIWTLESPSTGTALIHSSWNNGLNQKFGVSMSLTGATTAIFSTQASLATTNNAPASFSTTIPALTNYLAVDMIGSGSGLLVAGGAGQTVINTSTVAGIGAAGSYELAAAASVTMEWSNLSSRAAWVGLVLSALSGTNLQSRILWME